MFVSHSSLPLLCLLNSLSFAASDDCSSDVSRCAVASLHAVTEAVGLNIAEVTKMLP